MNTFMYNSNILCVQFIVCHRLKYSLHYLFRLSSEREELMLRIEAGEGSNLAIQQLTAQNSSLVNKIGKEFDWLIDGEGINLATQQLTAQNSSLVNKISMEVNQNR